MGPSNSCLFTRSASAMQSLLESAKVPPNHACRLVYVVQPAERPNTELNVIGAPPPM